MFNNYKDYEICNSATLKAVPYPLLLFIIIIITFTSVALEAGVEGVHRRQMKPVRGVKGPCKNITSSNFGTPDYPLTSSNRFSPIFEAILVDIFVECFNHLNSLPHCRSTFRNYSIINTYFQYILCTKLCVLYCFKVINNQWCSQGWAW